jgi:Prokaryotic homologs of the JAB domain
MTESFGERNALLKTLWVDASGPPPDSTHSAAGFVCGVRVTAELAKEKAKRSSDLVRFLGMWHTHPGGRPLPSVTDINGVEQLVGATSGKSLMLIIGGRERGRYDTAACIFSREDFERIQDGVFNPRMLHPRFAAIGRVPECGAGSFGRGLPRNRISSRVSPRPA